MTLMGRRSEASHAARVITAVLGISALLVTVGCTARDGSVAAQPLTTAGAQQTGAPVVVSCEPNQRTLVRPVVVNGATLSQVECVSNGLVADTSQPVVTRTPAPVSEPYRQVRATQPVYDDLGDARVVAAPRPATVARPVRTRQVVYDERPVRQTRSVKKSAIIIGSSAGVGAGVGAAVGGKKGALIGAAIGGGSAAIWDQVTRRDR